MTPAVTVVSHRRIKQGHHKRHGNIKSGKQLLEYPVCPRWSLYLPPHPSKMEDDTHPKVQTLTQASVYI